MTSRALGAHARDVAATTPTAIPDSGARLVVHWAANVPASVASHVLAPEPDYGHTALRWRDGLGLVSASIDGLFRVGLDLSRAEVFVARNQDVVSSFGLAGQGLQTAVSRLQKMLGAAGGPTGEGDAQVLDLTRPHHPVADGQSFEIDPAQWRLLADWFGFAARRLERVRAQHETASALRCWPHHFDIAALWTLDEHPDPETARSVGIGLSPGDESIEDPYFYVLPWPQPEERPTLPLGRWEGSFMVLDAAEILAATDGAAVVDRFLGDVSDIAARLVT